MNREIIFKCYGLFFEFREDLSIRRIQRRGSSHSTTKYYWRPPPAGDQNPGAGNGDIKQKGGAQSLISIMSYSYYARTLAINGGRPINLTNYPSKERTSLREIQFV